MAKKSDGRYRKVYTKMHADERYRRLTPSQPCGQMLWIQLICGRQTGIIPGLMSIGEAAFAEQLRWPLKAFREAFQEVFREGMVKADWEAQLIYIPNSIQYNAPASPNVVKSWREAWEELPECTLKHQAYKELKAFVEDMGEGFREAFREAIGESGAGAGTGTGTESNTLTPPTADVPVPKPRTPKPLKDTNPNHKPAIEHFTAEWRKWFRGDYPFTARDAKAIERILTAIGNDLDKFKRIVGRYFANTDRFFDGHAIPKLESSLAAFIAEPVGQWYDPMPGGTAK